MFTQEIFKSIIYKNHTKQIEKTLQPLSRKEALNVLSAWTALEVLSPTGFRKPEDLNDNKVESVILFDQKNLPWENGGEIAPKGKEIFYHVIIGTLNLDKCTEALIEKYGDLDAESPKMTGGAVIASITVNQFGCLVIDKPAVSLSSFAWGVPQVLNGSLKNLSQWPVQEQEILKEFKEILFAEIYAQGSAFLTNDMINRAYTCLIETLKIPLDLLHFHSYQKFAIRVYQSIPINKENAESPWPLLINSFFLNDLASAKDLISKGEAPENLLRYLGMKFPPQRHSVLKNYDLLQDILAPQKMPYARWPGKGRHSLVLKQQAAVNLSLSTLEEGGILGVNGPPGTGKTTLLRDVVAGIVTKRAEALLKFHDPIDAFIDTKYKVPAGEGIFSVYQLDNKLKGFEILIASCNNKAVENISAELPGLNAVAEDADDLRYFKTLSDYLLGDESWGLISAVLGNSSNRYEFCKKFWFDADFSIPSYLKEAEGINPLYKKKDRKTGKILETRKAQIIQDCDPPHNQKEAQEEWRKARKRFIEALRQVHEKFDDLQDKRDSIFQLQSFNKTLKENQNLKDLISEHQSCRPHFLTRFLRFPAARRWTKEYKRLSLWQNLKEKTEPYFKSLKSHLVDANLFLKSSKEYNQISPWCDKDLQILRDNVFIEAMKLHKAFINVVAKPLRHNLGIWVKYLAMPKEGIDKELSSYMSDIWSSFFLVVPSISTTFASANKMLDCLSPESLGWLLIDEAGQAVPQAAVGTLMKTRRAIVTGDPLQIEPVISLPSKLTKSIFEQFEANASKFNPPKVSVQTLADEASCYFATINDRLIGFPLLVHRRCTSPMFEISNNIAYNNLMVQAKKSQASLIRNCLGPSAWFDVQSTNEIQDKWCPEEGEKVVDLLKQLKNANVFPNLYIITPFKIVANHLRTKIKESRILESWGDIKPEKWIYNSVGTVHTFQGREAEAVILVLGAPLESQLGSKKWAGSTPNLLNVAVTRAQEVLYVVGNIELWQDIGVFKELESRLNFVMNEHEFKRFVVC